MRSFLRAFYSVLFWSCSVAAEDFIVRDGFRVEELYRTPLEQEGSWVSLCVDPRGSLYASDQYGYIYKINPPPAGQTNGLQVTRLRLEVGKAQGLCWAFDSLYFTGDPVPANDPATRRTDRRSLWRAQDSDGDGELDKLTQLLRLDSAGEHGPHGIALGPEGKLYLACGNHTPAPEFPRSLVPKRWQEDHLLPRMWDARGHARGIYAPGGWIARLNPDGSDLELVSIGYRNQYDLAFDANGELFTYDSDMEWDLGLPWYRPTRICHAVSGSEFGWRSGSGVWPDYYPDNLPPTLNIGPGSPTGVAFGEGAKFPEKYQRALYIMDWSFGTLYAAHLEPDGASYQGTKELFLARNALPLTDLVVRPQDGAMYFVTGGRRTRGGLYRVVYHGAEPTTPVPPRPLTAAQKLRRELESYHAPGQAGAVEAAWPHLANPDRFIRFAARTAIELQPVAQWEQRALSETRPRAAREAIMALARCSTNKALQSPALRKLLEQEWARLGHSERLEWLRVCSLLFTRWGEPSAGDRQRLLESFDARFPSTDAWVNRELGNLLIFLRSPTIAAKAIEQMYSAPEPPEEMVAEDFLKRGGRYASAISKMQEAKTHKQQIHFAFNLRVAETGWTPALREKYFAWFAPARAWSGGNSFQGFLANARDIALAKIEDPLEQQRLFALAGASAKAPAKPLPRPQGPGKAWTMADFSAVTGEQLKSRDLENGKKMFQAALCASCHLFKGEGSPAGPDLTGAAGRYQLADLLTAILDPNKEISDQYAFTEFTLADGSKIHGRLVRETRQEAQLIANFIVPELLTPVRKDQIKSQRPSPISPMMPGLINSLNRDEALDLLAFLMSGP